MRKLAFILFFFVATTAHATTQVISSGNTDTPRNSATEYNAFITNPDTGWTTSGGENDRIGVFPTAGTVQNLRVQLSGNPGAAASGKSYTFTVRKNKSNTSMSCAVSEDTATCQDSSNTFTVAKDDTISFASTPANTPDGTLTVHWSWEFVSDTSKEFVMLSKHTGHSSSGTRYHNVASISGNADSVEDGVMGIIPIAGSITKFSVLEETAPGAGKSWTYEIRLDGSGTGASITVSDTATTGSWSGSVAHSEGQEISIIATSSGTPSATPSVAFGIASTATTDGQYPLFSINTGSANASAVSFTNMGRDSDSATETARDANISSDTVKKMFAEAVDGTVGAGTFDVTLRRDTGGGAADTTITCQISSTTCSDTEDLSLTDDDLISIEFTPDGTPPTARKIQVGLLMSDGTGVGAARRVFVVN